MIATVIKASRRFITLLTEAGQEIEATSSTKALTITVGDQVEFATDQGGRALVSTVLKAKNSLERTFDGQTRMLAANLDHLFIVAATTPLFNTTFIDRVIAVCEIQRIPFTIVVNKADLRDATEASPDLALVRIYHELGYAILDTSVKESVGITELSSCITDPRFRIVAFTGISGVGKSSLIGAIMPNLDLRIGDVSKRTGQGRQTTSQPQAFRYDRPNSPPLLVIDLPGVQNFGVSNLDKSDIADAFIEIHKHRQYCQFTNCAHVQEKKCGVLTALEKGEIAPSRYESYLKILEEISEAAPY